MRVTPDNPDGCGLSPWLLDSGAPLIYEDEVHCEKMELAVFNEKVWIFVYSGTSDKRTLTSQ